MYLQHIYRKLSWNDRVFNDSRSCNLQVSVFYHLPADTLFHPSGRPDNFCLRFSRAIADEWLEFIDWSYVASSTTEKTKGSLVKRSRSLLYENAASAESRLDKQGCQTDVSCRPFFRPLWESLADTLPAKPCRSFAFRFSKLEAPFDDRAQENTVVIRKLNYIFRGKLCICTKSCESKDLEGNCITNWGQYFPIFK